MPNLITAIRSYEYSIERADALELAAEVLRDQAQEAYVQVIARLILDEFPTATHLALYPSDEREGYFEAELYTGTEEVEPNDEHGYVGDLAGTNGSTPTVADLVRRLHSNDNWERFTELREDEVGTPTIALNLRAALTGQAV